MDKLEKVLMVLAFIFAGLSAIMWYGQGFHCWIWQVTTMLWIVSCYLKQRTIDKLNK